MTCKVRVRRANRQKRKAHPARVAEVEQAKYLESACTRGTYKPQIPSGDRVAVLWKVPMAHKPRYMREPVPSR